MPHSPLEREQTGLAIYAVIQSLIDSQEALVEIGEKLEDQDLKRFCLAESLKRDEFRHQLELVLNQEGVGNLRSSAAEPGIVQQALADLRFRPRDVGHHQLLATAELGENAAREAYSNAITTFPSTPILQLLTTQAAHIDRTCGLVKAARKRAGGKRQAA